MNPRALQKIFLSTAGICTLFVSAFAFGQSAKVWYKPAQLPESYKLIRDSCLPANKEAFEACMTNAGWTLVERGRIEASRKECREKYSPAADNQKAVGEYYACLRDSGWEDEPISNKQLRDANLKLKEEVCDNPKYSDAIKNIPCLATEITLEHLANAGRISEENKRIYLDFFKQLEDFRTKTTRIRNDGSMAQRKLSEFLISTIDPKVDDDRVALITGKLNFGEYNKRRKEIQSDIQKMSNKINEETKDFINSPPKGSK